METDRYGNRISFENSIVIFEPCMEYDAGDNGNTDSQRLQDIDPSRYSCACEADLGAGADWPVVAFELLNRLIPFTAIAALLFSGDRGIAFGTEGVSICPCG